MLLWDIRAPHPALQEKVEGFSRSHMFMINKHVKPTILQRRRFTRDVYDYARAVGMGKHQADVEVLRARAAYRRDRGLPGAHKWDQSDDESTLGSEINDGAEYITFVKDRIQFGPRGSHWSLGGYPKAASKKYTHRSPIEEAEAEAESIRRPCR